MDNDPTNDEQEKTLLPNYGALSDFVREIKKCEAAGATMAAATLCYVCIDTLAYLSMSLDRNNTTKKDFIDWVNTYLKSHPDQPYKYRGIDVYAARCAVLHTWGAEAQIHRQDLSVVMFGYSDGGRHFHSPEVSKRLVIIGVPSFINDVVIGIEEFLAAAMDDEGLRARLDLRVNSVFAHFPFPGGTSTLDQ